MKGFYDLLAGNKARTEVLQTAIAYRLQSPFLQPV